MTVEDCLNALQLPPESRVDQRVPKKTLSENGATTAAQRRLVQEGVEELRWVATLKPMTVGVPVYRDSNREYLEVAVLSLRQREAAKGTKLLELVHRAIPYPVVLASSDAQGTVSVSLAHKRWSKGEKAQTVVDGEVITETLDDQLAPELIKSFYSALPLAEQDRNTLYNLYQGWVDALVALQTARTTGRFALPRSAEHAAERREALLACTRLSAEMASLKRSAGKEKQLARKVELNLKLKQLAEAHAAALKRL